MFRTPSTLGEWTVNRYGALAMDHWRQHRPQALSELEEPEVYFTDLGEALAEAIETRTRALASPEPAGEGYLERLQRLNSATRQAEGEVLREMVLLKVEQEG